MNEPIFYPVYCFGGCAQHCITSYFSLLFDLSVLFTITTLLVSAYNVWMHLKYFNNPFFQSKIVVILIMAPFYCLTSLGSFVWPSLQVYFTLTRDAYEAVLLFTFFYLIFSYLAYDRDRDTMEDKKVYLIMIQHQNEVHHFFPIYYCQKPYQLTHWKKAKYFTYRCKKYVLQFLIVKIGATLFMYIAYDQNQPTIVASIVSWLVGISCSYSLYYLVLFYHALRRPLSPYSPLLKFLTIKITLFFTFWQKIMIGIFMEEYLSCFDLKTAHYHPLQIIASLENTLICFQMLVMAVAGGFAYSYNDYIVRNNVNSQGNAIDVFKDTLRAFKNDFRLIKPKSFGFVTQIKQQIQLKQIAVKEQSVSKKIFINLNQNYVSQYL